MKSNITRIETIIAKICGLWYTMYLQRLVNTSDTRAVRHDIFSIPNLLHDNIPKIGKGVCIYVKRKCHTIYSKIH